MRRQHTSRSVVFTRSSWRLEPVCEVQVKAGLPCFLLFRTGCHGLEQRLIFLRTLISFRFNFLRSSSNSEKDKYCFKTLVAILRTDKIFIKSSYEQSHTFCLPSNHFKTEAHLTLWFNRNSAIFMH